jgi:hypothetical protein
LIRLRKGIVAKQLNEPELSFITEQPIAVEQAVTAKPVEKINYAEDDLIRILVKYGAFELEINQINELGEKVIVKTSVAEYICHEIERDELRFFHPTYRAIHHTISVGIAEGILYKSSYLLRSEDQEVVKIVSTIESDAYELSHNWLSKYNIDTNTELDNLRRAVTEAVYAFKSEKVQHRIHEIRAELEVIDPENHTRMEDLISEQIVLEQIKKAISEQMGRIILR